MQLHGYFRPKEPTGTRLVVHRIATFIVGALGIAFGLLLLLMMGARV